MSRRTPYQRAMLAFEHGGRALRLFALAEAELGRPIVGGQADYLLDHLPTLSELEARKLAAIYRAQPYVARSRAAELAAMGLAHAI